MGRTINLKMSYTPRGCRGGTCRGVPASRRSQGNIWSCPPKLCSRLTEETCIGSEAATSLRNPTEICDLLVGGGCENAAHIRVSAKSTLISFESAPS